MIEAIKYNLSHLTDFSGRDARPTFWWYALFLLIAQWVIGFLAAIPMVVSSAGSAIDTVQSGADPEQVQVEMMSGMADAMGTQIYISAVISVIVMLMFVASFVRRLHDGGCPGLLAIIPIALQVIAIGDSIAVVGEIQELLTTAAVNANNPAEMQQLEADLTFRWSNMAGWLAILVVAGFGVMKSQHGPNRYGEEPASIA